MEFMNNSASVRKAAILLASLDPHTADALLRQMDAKQSERLRLALSSLGEVDAIEQAQVASEFLDSTSSPVPPVDGGVEFDSELAERFAESIVDDSDLSAGEATSLPVTKARDGEARAARFLSELAIGDLVELLASEHPQTIAVIISLLTADRAAEAIAGLAGPLQADVVRRLVDLDKSLPEVAQEVIQGLERRHRQRQELMERRAARLSAVSGMLDAADRATSQQIRGNVVRHATELAISLGHSTLPFAELGRLDDASLWTLLSAADPDWVVLAVAGAPPALADRVIKLLPADERDEFCKAIADLGPTRLSDIEEAQRRVAELASQLEFSGEIQAPAARLAGVAR